MMTYRHGLIHRFFSRSKEPPSPGESAAKRAAGDGGKDAAPDGGGGGEPPARSAKSAEGATKEVAGKAGKGAASDGGGKGETAARSAKSTEGAGKQDIGKAGQRATSKGGRAAEEAIAHGKEGLKKAAGEGGKGAASDGGGGKATERVANRLTEASDLKKATKVASKGLTNSLKSLIGALPGKGVTAGIIGVATLAAGTALIVNAINSPKSSTLPGNVSATEVISLETRGEDSGDVSDEAELPTGGGSKESDSGASVDPIAIPDVSQLTYNDDTTVIWFFEMVSDTTPEYPECGDGAPYNGWIRDVTYQDSNFISNTEEHPYIIGAWNSAGDVLFQITGDVEHTIDGCPDHTDLQGKRTGQIIEGTYSGHDCSNSCIWSGTFRVTIDG